MKIKKLGAAVIAASMLLGTLAGCGKSAEATAKSSGKAAEASDPASSGDSSVTLTIWATGSDNVRQIYEKLVEEFNNNSKYKGKYTAKLQFMLNGTGAQSMTDMLNAAYQADQKDTDYDLVDFSGDDLSKMVSLLGEDAFVKVDESKVPNRKNIKAESAVAGDHTQAYRGTTVILAYDSAKISEPPKTVDDLVRWIKANPGRFVYNTPGTGGSGDSFARTSVYNFIDDKSATTSDDEKWMEKWDDGFQFLKDIHEYMYKSGGSIVYPNKNQGALDLLNQGEIDMCPMWADMVLSQRSSGQLKDSIKIAQIDPAFTGALQTLAIPTIGSHQDAAFAFMNFMCSNEAQQIMVQQMAAIPLVDASQLDMTGFEDVQNLDVSRFRIMSIGALGTRFNERWDSEIASAG